MRPRDRNFVVAAIVALLVLTGATIAVCRQPAFWTDFVANLDATLIGSGAGIPIGLWVSGLVREREEKTEAEAILSLLEKELKLNLGVAGELARLSREDKKDYPAALAAFTGFRDGFWRATRDAGRTRLIRDEALLAAVVTAYGSVAVLTLLADSLFRGNLIVTGGLRGFDGPFDAKWWDEVDKAEPAIRKACEAIDSHLGRPATD